MGLVDWLTRRKAKQLAPEAALLIHDTLSRISDSKQSETKFRDDTVKILRQLGGVDDIKVKREAGVHGSRIDIHLHMLQHDFLITIKKGLSSQKIKTVMGEICDYFTYFKPRVSGNTTFVFLFVYGVSRDIEWDAVDSFDEFANRENARRTNFWIGTAFAGSIR